MHLKRQVCSTQEWNQGKAPVMQHALAPSSLLYPRVESRQSLSESADRLIEVCSTQEWNQGKANNAGYALGDRVCSTQEWNQGKAAQEMVWIPL